MDVRPYIMWIHPRQKVFYIWNNASESQALCSLLSGGSCKGLARLQFFASGKESTGDMNFVNRHFHQSLCLWRIWSKSFCGKKERKLLTKLQLAKHPPRQSTCTLRPSGEEMKGKGLCNLQITQNSPNLSPWVAISTGSNDNLLSVLKPHHAIMTFLSLEVFILFSAWFPCPWLSLMLRSVNCYRITNTFQCRLEKVEYVLFGKQTFVMNCRFFFFFFTQLRGTI